MINIYYKGEFLAKVSGSREAAKLVASRENIENIYWVENSINNSILTGNALGEKYTFKIVGD